MRIEVQQNCDETGAAEELTWDLFPLGNPSEVAHLDESGLPKIGTLIRPGMVLVGKIAKSQSYDPARQPTALEIHALDRQSTCSKYGHMWRDTSVRATEAQSGLVTAAFLEQRDGMTVAVVDIEREV